MCEVSFSGQLEGKKSPSSVYNKDSAGFPPSCIPSRPQQRSSAALKCYAVTLEGPRSSSPAGNQPSFFHEAVSVQERLWISPAASASNTSCYTLGNMTTALPPSSLHLNTLLYLMT